MSYTFNAEEAKKADIKSTAILESGKYEGVITSAVKLSPESGAVGICLSFTNDDGQSANYLNLYTLGKDGKPTFSMQTMHAILGCLKISDLQEGNVKTKDKNGKDKIVTGYPAIIGKRIGLLLQRELSSYDGKDYDNVVIYGVFEAGTGFTISEILSKATEPKQAGKITESLTKYIDRRKKSNSTPQSPSDNFNNDHW